MLEYQRYEDNDDNQRDGRSDQRWHDGRKLLGRDAQARPLHLRGLLQAGIAVTVMQGIRVTVAAVGRGYPKTTVITVTNRHPLEDYPPKKGR